MPSSKTTLDASLLETGSIINVHRHDGSSTGGAEYLGLRAFVSAAQRVPELAIAPAPSFDEIVSVPVSELAWIDTLATPFRARDFLTSTDAQPKRVEPA
jgi:hypothetical protein